MLSERGRRRVGFFCAAAVVLPGAVFLPNVAQARSRQVGDSLVQRPLVLPEGVLRIDGGPSRPYFGGQISHAGQFQLLTIRDASDRAFLVPGAAYGLGSGVELGGVWPLRIAPDLDLSDISAYAKYQLQQGNVELAGYGELRIPVESDLELAAGLPVRVHLDTSLSLDTGGYFRIVFQDDPLGVFHVPLSLSIGLAPEWTLVAEAGLELIDFDELNLPLGVMGAYSVRSGVGTLGDFFVRLGLGDISEAGELWRIDVGAQMYFDL